MCMTPGAPKKPAYGPCNESHGPPTAATWTDYITGTGAGGGLNGIVWRSYTTAGTSTAIFPDNSQTSAVTFYVRTDLGTVAV